MEPLDNKTISLASYGDDRISDDEDKRISDIIHSINYMKIRQQKEIDAVLDSIEYIDRNDYIINAQREKYCKLTFYFNNPISGTQTITWGKHIVIIHTRYKDNYSPFHHPEPPYDYQVGKTYTLVNTGYNQWRVKQPQ